MVFSPSSLFLATVSLAKNAFCLTIWDLLSCSESQSTTPVLIETGSEKRSLNVVSLIWQHNDVYVSFNDGHLATFTFSHYLQNPEGRIESLPLESDERLVGFCLFRGKAIAATFNRLLIDGVSMTIDLLDDDKIVSISLQERTGCLYLATQKTVLILHLQEQCSFVKMINDGQPFTANIQTIVSHPDKPIFALILKDKSIRALEFSKSSNGDTFVMKQRYKLHDVVDRWPWSEAGFSHDGELIWGSFREHGRHLVYIWDTGSGSLRKTLEGPREDLSLALWDPLRPSIITCGVYGSLYRWVPDYPTKWNALIPGLQEIEENVIYEEREDEFDLSIENLPCPSSQNDEGPVDVLTGLEIIIEKIPLSL